MPRLYREAPLNSIWEGSGNVNSLDVLRAMTKTPEALDAFWAEVDLAAGADARLDAWVARTKAAFSDFETIEFRARHVVEGMALALQGSLIVRNSPSYVADAFCASRLGGEHGRAYGTLPPGVDVTSIVERHRPHVP
jgi:putative acyl-CoA dehydrogenase